MAQDSVDTSGRVLDHDHVLRTGLDQIGNKATCLCYDRPVLPDPAIGIAFTSLRKRAVAGRDYFGDHRAAYAEVRLLQTRTIPLKAMSRRVCRKARERVLSLKETKILGERVESQSLRKGVSTTSNFQKTKALLGCQKLQETVERSYQCRLQSIIVNCWCLI